MEILYRSGTRNGRLIPLFLSIKDQETLDIIGELISTFESSINKPASNFIDEAYYLERFSEVKLFLNIVEVLTRHFYSISTLESSGESQPWDLREKLFSYLTEQNYSFVGPKDHEIILKELAVANSLNVDELKEDLFADHSIFTKLTRREGENSIPLPNDVVETYNLESFYALVRRSFWMQFELERISADVSFIDSFVVSSKRSRIFVDYSLTGESVQVRILGPREIENKQQSYSRTLIAFLRSNLDFFQKKNLELCFSIEVDGIQRVAVIEMAKIELKTLLGAEESKTKIDEFDSTVEQKFKSAFSALKSDWQISREPVIIDRGVIMVPDFQLTYGSTILYVEIIGFWTEGYLNHKARKIKILESKYKDMVLFIDEKLPFPSTTLKTFLYGKKLPMADFLQYLREFYEIFELKKLERSLFQQRNTIFSLLASIIGQGFMRFEDASLRVGELGSKDKIKYLASTGFFDSLKTFGLVCAVISELFLSLKFLWRIQEILSLLEGEKPMWEGEQLVSRLHECLETSDWKAIRISLKVLGVKWRMKSLDQEQFDLESRLRALDVLASVMNA